MATPNTKLLLLESQIDSMRLKGDWPALQDAASKYNRKYASNHGCK